MHKVGTNRSNNELIRQRIYDSYPDTGPHGKAHIDSVLRYSKSLNNMSDNQVLELAALLHDIGHKADGDHTVVGLELAKPYLSQLTNLSKDDKLGIEDAIQNHMSKGHPTTQIGRIVADADRLSGINEIPKRSLEYHMSKGRDEAKAYWHFRHVKVPRLKNQRSFHTDNGKALHDAEIDRLVADTSTIAGYRRLAQNGVQTESK